MKKQLCAVVLALLVGAATDTSHALPRFALRTGAKCQSCHVNPSGGGMRQAFGVQYGRETLPVPTWSEDLGFDELSTKISETISVGADFRTLYFLQDYLDSTGTNSSTNNAFWQMQGDLYLHFKLAQKVSIYLDKGLYSGFEIFGLLTILPGNGHIKIGKFTPNYGMKLDDHRTFIRTETGFSPERGRPELTGGEIGVNAGPINIGAGVYNASDGFGAGVGDQKAFLGRVDGIFKFSDDVHLGLGANAFTRKMSGSDRFTLLGAIGSFGNKDLALLREVDLRQTKIAGTKATGVVSYVEADYVATPGLDLKFIYEFFDPDKDLKTGAISRYTFGVEFFPVTGVEVRPLFRIASRDPKNTFLDVPKNELNVLVHFYL